MLRYSFLLSNRTASSSRTVAAPPADLISSIGGLTVPEAPASCVGGLCQSLPSYPYSQ